MLPDTLSGKLLQRGAAVSTSSMTVRRLWHRSGWRLGGVAALASLMRGLQMFLPSLYTSSGGIKTVSNR